MTGKRATPPLSPEAMECLQRTRSAVWNVIMCVGLGIGASGLLLRRRQWGEAPLPAEIAWRWAYLGLMGLILLSTLARLLSVMPWASRRPSRFLGSHLASAILGSLAVPLGFAFSWMVRPRLDAVAPFWAAALILSFLALPRRDEIELINVPDQLPGKTTTSGPLPSTSEPRS